MQPFYTRDPNRFQTDSGSQLLLPAFRMDKAPGHSKACKVRKGALRPDSDPVPLLSLVLQQSLPLLQPPISLQLKFIRLWMGLGPSANHPVVSKCLVHQKARRRCYTVLDGLV